jgi:hypothetical protein
VWGMPPLHPGGGGGGAPLVLTVAQVVSTRDIFILNEIWATDKIYIW